MKFAALTISALLITTAAHASMLKEDIQDCGLPTSTSSELYEEAGRSIDAGRMNAKSIHRLPSITKQQLILAAKAFVEQNEDDKAIENSVGAVEYMKQMEGPYIQNYEISGEQYTEILSYPGENPYGFIFARGTTHIVASIHDGDIVCR